MWKAALMLACVAGLLMGQTTAPAPQAAPPQPASPVAKQPQVKSAEEMKALTALFQAPDADTRIKAAEELLVKFADTEFKATALFFEALSYQQKNDFVNTMVFAERTLEADPNHYQAMIVLASTIAMRTQEFDLDREEKLVRAEKSARQALDLIKASLKPNPNLTDEQWEAAKKDFSSQVYEALGLAALVRKNFDGAVAEFKRSIEIASTPDPTTSIRLGNAYTRAGKYDEAIGVLDKVMADPNTPPQFKQFAQAEKARAVQSKAGGAKPESPAAAPQVEIKKQ
jgi:tetratricopeptide (TPR) repeat protein